MAFLDEIYEQLEKTIEPISRGELTIDQILSSATFSLISPADFRDPGGFRRRQEREQERLREELEAQEVQKQFVQAQSRAQRLSLLSSPGRQGPGSSASRRDRAAIDFSQAPPALAELETNPPALSEVNPQSISGTF